MTSMKYNEIMSKVTVTPQIRERVLKNARLHRNKGEEGQKSRKEQKGGHKILPFLRFLPVAAAACLVLVMGIVMQRSGRLQPSPAAETDLVYSGITEYDSLQKLESAAGFSMDEGAALAGSIPFPVKETVYSDAVGVARIDYFGADGELITFSKAEDDGTDILGDYNEYAEVTEEKVNGIPVTIKGDGDQVNLATFTRDGYAYAIDTMTGVSENDMIRMAEAVLKGQEAMKQ